MDSKSVLRNLIEKSVKGNFDNVLITLKLKKYEVDTNGAIKITAAICNACNDNISTPNNINEWNLVKLLKCLIDLIKVPTSQHFECYLQSAFYILKLLLEKQSYDCIIQLEEFFMPEFKPLILTPKQGSIYQSICKSMYNAVVKISNAKEKKHSNSALKLAYLLSSLYRKINITTSLLESAHNCIIGLSALSIDAEELSKYYLHVLNLIDIIEDNSVYRIFINNFSYLYTYLLKNEKFKLAETCYDKTLIKTRDIFKGKEFMCLSEILEIIKWINPVLVEVDSVEVPHRSHKSLKNYYQKYGSTINLQAVCDLISSVAFVVLQYYKNVDSSKWVDKLSPEHHSQYYKFLHDVVHVMANTPYKCHCKNCPTKTNLNEALRCMNTISASGRLFITSKTDVPRTYKIDILKYLELYAEYVVVLKTNNCIKWRNYWYDVSVHLYSIGIHLIQSKDVELCLVYLRKFVYLVIQFEGVEPSIIAKNYFNIALSTIADIYLDSKEYEKSLLISAFNIAITKDTPSSEIHRWIRTKVACRESTLAETNEIQELTLTSVFQKCKSEFSFYCPRNEFKLEKKTCIELLIYELDQYKMKWKSKLPMMAVYRELCQIADSSTLANVFINTWGECDLLVHELIPRLLQDTIRKLELYKSKSEIENLAHLYFLQHKYRVKQTVVKHCDEMERTLNMTQASSQNGSSFPTDPNAECDIVSSYECLKMSRYLQMMKELNKSFGILCEILSNDYFNEPVNQDKVSRLYKLLIKIAHEYALDNYTTKALQAWELALKIAKFHENKIFYLQAAGFIIESSNVKKPLIKKLIKKSDEIATELISRNYQDQYNYEVIIIYYLCKAEAYFYVDFNTAYKAFQLALKIYMKITGNCILNAKIHFYYHKFVTLPCKFDVEGHKEYSLVKIHQAQYEVVKFYNETSGDYPYEMKIFFDVSEALIKMYHDMRLPREVRCYGKDIVMIAQKMVLPFRTACLLHYLAEADINSSRLDDARVKIMDFSDILGISKCKSVTRNQHLTPKKENIQNVVDNLAWGLNEMMLDVPHSYHQLSPSGSPKLSVETFKVPSFLSHEDCCECFYCTSLEYQQLVLKKTYLHALLYQHESNICVAKDFFDGCLKIYEYLMIKQYFFMKKLEKRISQDLIFLPQYEFVEIYCLVLYEYSNYSLRLGNIVEAKNTNEKLITALEPFNLKYTHLHNAALLQKLNILTFTCFDHSENTQNISCDDMNVAMIVTTPESKHSQVFISPMKRYETNEKIKIIPKNLCFDLSDNEEENAETKKNSNLLKNTPSYSSCKTPAPSISKIKIYTNKSSRRKKILADIPPPKAESDFLVPMSPEAQTPNAFKSVSKVDSALTNRTKLLTERLKNSTRKCDKFPSVVVNDENSEACGSSNKSESSVKQLSVRQNLLSQLEQSEDIERDRKLRRSKRNKN